MTSSRRLSARKRGYTSEWDKAAKAFLIAHPHCAMCAEFEQRTPATVVDHKVPHRGDPTLFWNRANWQGLCAPHHNGPKQQIDNRGYHTEVGLDGMPTDPRHPFNCPERPTPTGAKNSTAASHRTGGGASRRLSFATEAC